MNALQYLVQSPPLNRRARPRVVAARDDTASSSTSLSFAFDEENNTNNNSGIVAYDKTRLQLENIFRKITTDSIGGKGDKFLQDPKVTTALNSGRDALMPKMDDGKNEYEYGTLVEALSQLIEETRTASEPSEQKNILLWMLEEIDVSKEKGAKRREHLTELLLLLVELVPPKESPMYVQYTKDVVLFQLRFLLPNDRGKIWYKQLLDSLGLPVIEENTSNAQAYKTLMKQAIVAHIVGNDSMDTVVSLFDSKEFADLPKKFSNLPISWATDDFEKDEEARVDEQVKELTLTAVTEVTSEDNVQGEAVVASVGLVQNDSFLAGGDNNNNNNSETTQVIALAADDGDPLSGKQLLRQAVAEQRSTIDQQNSALDHLQSIIVKLGEISTLALNQCATLTLDSEQIGAMRATVHALLANARASTPSRTSAVVETDTTTISSFQGSVSATTPPAPSPLTVDADTAPTAPSSITSNSQSLRVSPLAVPDAPVAGSVEKGNNGFGNSVNGLSITKKGLRSCLQHLASESESFKKTFEQFDRDWKGTVDEPKEGVEEALAGRHWGLKDFEILALKKPGKFGQVLEVRLKQKPSIRACAKVEEFSPTSFNYFARELIEGGKVKHKNIIKTLGYFPIPMEKTGRICICMCLLQEKGGSNLKEEVKRVKEKDPLKKIHRACKYLEEILAAVVALEKAGVSHRDIKPENIVHGRDGNLKIIDFGLSRGVDEEGSLSCEAGTGPYIPPEQKGPKHDIFSSGVVFHELVTGNRPQQDKDSVTRDGVACAFQVDAAGEVGNLSIDLCINMIQPVEKKRWTAQRAADACKKILSLCARKHS